MLVNHKLRHAEKIARLLDNQFRIGPFKFGLDPIIGLFPGIGDIISLVFSAYLILIALQEKLEQTVIFKMIFYSFADFIIGTVPILGDVADFFYKSSLKNYELIKSELRKKYDDTGGVIEGELIED